MLPEIPFMRDVKIVQKLKSRAKLDYCEVLTALKVSHHFLLIKFIKSGSKTVEPKLIIQIIFWTF